ncbi:MAG: Maf family nucleotide pyrophosphatase [Flavobacteriales bacterium]
MLLPNLTNKKIVLASKSPRRQQLLKGLELDFEVRTKEVDESFPRELFAQDIPIFLSKVKAEAFRSEMREDEIIITADTVVWINDHVMNKPESRDEAIAMIEELSGTMHTVYTAVTMTSADKQFSFCDEAKVYFVPLSKFEIEHYIDQYQPFDKAGAYGVQELIGYIAIEKMEGSYFTVMGLPVQKLYELLKKW